jgi:hypothetical protein
VLDAAEQMTSIGRALSQLEQSNLEGLETLLGLPGLALILTSPPGVSDATAWALLEGAGPDSLVVLNYASFNQASRPGWQLEQLGAESDSERALEALERCPDTMALMSVLDGPVSVEALASITGEPSADVTTAGVTLLMPSGVVLTASARTVVRARVGADSIERAHGRAFEARQAVPALIESDDKFAVVRHLVGAGARELFSFVRAMAERSSSDWSDGDWLRLAHSLEPAKDKWDGLAASIRLGIASALVIRQSGAQAELWLDEVATEGHLQEAWRQHLLSEIFKAKGTVASRERMWKHSRDALRCAEEGRERNPTDRRFILAIRELRQNTARLELYFNHAAESARSIFASILDELADEPEVEIAALRVATLRNLAECLFEFAPFSSQPGARHDARSHLLRAIEVAQKHELDALAAEVLYTTAKLDEVELDWAAARDHLSQAVEKGRSANHAVCLRIAEMRLYWLGVRHEGQVHDQALFLARLRRLEFLEAHAWARRYAAQSRIWAARQLEQGHRGAEMQSVLERNIAAFDQSGRISSDADLRLVALSYAGLASYEIAAGGGTTQHQDGWRQFKAAAADRGWRDAGTDDPSAYWKEGS